MPGQKEDYGRGFDIYGALMWEQRIEKEENNFLRKDHRRSRKRSQRTDERLGRLERQLAETRSVPDLMYRTDALPNDLRAMQRSGVADRDLMTLRSKPRQNEDVVPMLRLKRNEVDAHWVPGRQRIVEYKPEFYFEDANCTKKEVWQLPPAGYKPKAPTAIGDGGARVSFGSGNDFRSTRMSQHGSVASEYGRATQSASGLGMQAGSGINTASSGFFRPDEHKPSIVRIQTSGSNPQPDSRRIGTSSALVSVGRSAMPQRPAVG